MRPPPSISSHHRAFRSGEERRSTRGRGGRPRERAPAREPQASLTRQLLSRAPTFTQNGTLPDIRASVDGAGGNDGSNRRSSCLTPYVRRFYVPSAPTRQMHVGNDTGDQRAARRTRRMSGPQAVDTASDVGRGARLGGTHITTLPEALQGRRESHLSTMPVRLPRAPPGDTIRGSTRHHVPAALHPALNPRCALSDLQGSLHAFVSRDPPLGPPGPAAGPAAHRRCEARTACKEHSCARPAHSEQNRTGQHRAVRADEARRARYGSRTLTARRPPVRRRSP